MTFQPDHIAILGAGESGIGAAILARQQGHAPLLIEEQRLNPDTRAALQEAGIPFEEESSIDSARLLHFDWLVKSPGIPPWHPVVEQARQHDLPVIGEVELASWFTRATLIGVTGTNGKTTTVNLLYQLLAEAGYDVGLAGNTGASFSRQLTRQDHAYWVLELSSFQLEDIRHYHNSIAILLNITPDHLNRYPGGMPGYAEAKFRITLNQTANDCFIFNLDDPYTQQYQSQYANLAAQQLPFSQEPKPEAGAWIDKGSLYLQGSGSSASIPLAAIPFSGSHQYQNILSASLAAFTLGVGADQITATLQAFEAVPHRMEEIAGPAGLTFINDSKGSNLDATFYALQTVSAPVIWIAGGQDKGNAYSQLQDLVAEKVRHLVALGADNAALAGAFRDVVPISETQQMSEAVRLAYQHARAGDTILLSPACASFDLFRDFTDRGDQFKAAVAGLPATSKTTSAR